MLRRAMLLITLALLFVATSCPKRAPERGELQTAVAFAPEVPSPVRRDRPARIEVVLEAVERRGELAAGVTYDFWAYNGRVPGPFIRARVGDTLEVTLRNRADSRNVHTVDFHAVTGPGGGAPILMAGPGEMRRARFRLLNPGVYIYHCAVPPIPTHIANGLYGLILVEPAGGLPPVDREYYVVQSEFYTSGRLGEPGHHSFSAEKGSAERPEYVVFNGRVGAPTGDGALRAAVGERVRLYVGNAGPNLASSFHVIGEIFDLAYREGSVSQPEENVQTTLIPPGSASIVEFRIQVPGEYTLVDHSIFRIQRGAIGTLRAKGSLSAAIYLSGGAVTVLETLVPGTKVDEKHEGPTTPPRAHVYHRNGVWAGGLARTARRVYIVR